MFCFIYKWFISRSMDTGKPVPGFILRHLGHCKSCKCFAEIGQVVNERLVHDTPGILVDSRDSLSERITAAVHNSPTPALGRPFKPRQRSFRLAFSTLAATLLIVAGVWWFSGSTPPTPTNENLNTFAIPSIKTMLTNVGTEVESPLATELNGLKEALHSTTKFIVSNMDFGISDKSL